MCLQQGGIGSNFVLLICCVHFQAFLKKSVKKEIGEIRALKGHDPAEGVQKPNVDPKHSVSSKTSRRRGKKSSPRSSKVAADIVNRMIESKYVEENYDMGVLQSPGMPERPLPNGSVRNSLNSALPFFFVCS